VLQAEEQGFFGDGHQLLHALGEANAHLVVPLRPEMQLRGDGARQQVPRGLVQHHWQHHKRRRVRQAAQGGFLVALDGLPQQQGAVGGVEQVGFERALGPGEHGGRG